MWIGHVTQAYTSTVPVFEFWLFKTTYSNISKIFKSSLKKMDLSFSVDPHIFREEKKTCAYTKGAPRKNSESNRKDNETILFLKVSWYLYVIL